MTGLCVFLGVAAVMPVTVGHGLAGLVQRLLLIVYAWSFPHRGFEPFIRIHPFTLR